MRNYRGLVKGSYMYESEGGGHLRSTEERIGFLFGNFPVEQQRVE